MALYPYGFLPIVYLIAATIEAKPNKKKPTNVKLISSIAKINKPTPDIKERIALINTAFFIAALDIAPD